jgi:hypothetical protein
MRNLQTGFTNDEVSHQKDIQIQGARTVADTGRAATPEPKLEFEQGLEQCRWGKCGGQCDHGVGEARLVRKSHRFGQVEGRTGDNAPQLFQSRRGRGQGRLGRARMAGQVGAHSDVCRLHGGQDLSKGWGARSAPVTVRRPSRVPARAASEAYQTANATRTAQAGATPTRLSRKGRKFQVVMWT